jgi:hypothetical protein
MFNHGHFVAQGRRVLADSRELVPINSKNAYKNIQIEFKDYCRQVPVFATSELPEAVNEEKLSGFMFYNACRPKRPKSRKHDFFDKEDYDQVLEDPPADRTSQFSDLEVASRHYAGPEAWETAFGAVLWLAKHQHDKTGVGSHPSNLKSERIKRLQEHVKARVPHLREARFEEKTKM